MPRSGLQRKLVLLSFSRKPVRSHEGTSSLCEPLRRLAVPRCDTPRMHPRATELIQHLNLAQHPEGGWFVQTYRSLLEVNTDDGRTRSSLTLIYFLLGEGMKSRWHRVKSEEAWHFYEGAPLELLVVAPRSSEVARIVLGPLTADSRPQHVVPAGCWQAARPLGDYSLVGCSVGPGFDFSDFALLDAAPKEEWPKQSVLEIYRDLV